MENEIRMYEIINTANTNGASGAQGASGANGANGASGVDDVNNFNNAEVDVNGQGTPIIRRQNWFLKHKKTIQWSLFLGAVAVTTGGVGLGVMALGYSYMMPKDLSVFINSCLRNINCKNDNPFTNSGEFTKPAGQICKEYTDLFGTFHNEIVLKKEIKVENFNFDTNEDFECKSTFACDLASRQALCNPYSDASYVESCKDFFKKDSCNQVYSSSNSALDIEMECGLKLNNAKRYAGGKIKKSDETFFIPGSCDRSKYPMTIKKYNSPIINLF